jgi:hypothetical protein
MRTSLSYHVASSVTGGFPETYKQWKTAEGKRMTGILMNKKRLWDRIVYS